MSWTDERVEVLKKLWVDGLSASQIAKQLGSVTRNAVIGKVHRLGLAGRATPTRPIQRVVRPRPILVATPPKSIEITDIKSAQALDIDPSDTISRPSIVTPIAPKRQSNGNLIGVLDLGPSMCKWPIGDPTDPDFGFCGAKSHENWPYCEEHGAIAYQPQVLRKAGLNK